MDFSLGETADMLRETVRDFAMARVAARAEAIERDAEPGHLHFAHRCLSSALNTKQYG